MVNLQKWMQVHAAILLLQFEIYFTIYIVIWKFYLDLQCF